MHNRSQQLHAKETNMKKIKSFILSIMAVSAIFLSLGTDNAKANEGDVGPPHVSPSEQEKVF